MFFLFSLIGVASETALAVALIGRVATIVVSLTGGLSYLIKK
jgi:hypothetical protein